MKTILEQRRKHLLASTTYLGELLPLQVGNFKIRAMPLRCEKCQQSIDPTASRAQVKCHTNNALAVDMLVTCSCGERVIRKEYLALSRRLYITLIDEQDRQTVSTYRATPQAAGPSVLMALYLAVRETTWRVVGMVFGALLMGCMAMLRPLESRLGEQLLPLALLLTAVLIVVLTIGAPSNGLGY
ncbi:hypothetical protein J7355_13130 [Endozoicomonas sp. G2_2]|uniref:hypothetical protein n=1 Tax=Endozoicomonas sp. G2_2 TaxID=2821092 RepID=UPI001ADA2422|nr:hypothetical protein [Endozoicomonas sp. G2_2]MBO9471037.1 hypothetical protein [Endozoicomonas sp. G2_2]